MKISACYIVKDEAEELRRSLQSIKGQADEIILVQTVECPEVKAIGEEFGARLLFFPWENDFAKARNFGLKEADGDWLVLLDADEYFTEDTAKSLRKIVEKYKEKEALLVPLTNLGTEGADLTAPALRLARNRKGLAYVGRIHEELCWEGRSLQSLQLLSEKELHIEHTGYRAELSSEKAERNFQMLQEEMECRQTEGEETGSLYMYLAEAAHGLDREAEAERYARLDIAQGRRQVLYASRSYHLLLEILGKDSSRSEERLSVAQRAVQDFPELPELWAELSLCLGAVYDFRGAEEAMAKALALPEPQGLEPVLFTDDLRKMAQAQLKIWRELLAEAERLRISACVIVKNEERELPLWLEKSKVYADEMIVVDTGSADRTREMAIEAGAKVFDFVWCDDFAAAKNEALNRASEEWIVFLDADETFDRPELLRNFLAMRSREQFSGAVSVLVRAVDVETGEQPILDYPAIRVWKNLPGRRYEGNIHEVLKDGGAEIGLFDGRFLTVRHTGYSSGRVRAKYERNLKLLWQKIEQQGGEQPEDYRYLMDCCYGLGEYALAEHYGKLALEKGPMAIDGNREVYWRLLDCLREQGKSQAELLSWLKHAEEVFPEDEDFKGEEGLLLTDKGWHDEGIRLLTEFAGGGYAREGMMAKHVLKRALPRLGLRLVEAGRKEEALGWLSSVLESNPYNPEMWQGLRLLLQPGEFLTRLMPQFKERSQALRELWHWGAEAMDLELLAALAGEFQAAGLAIPQRELWEKVLAGDRQAALEQAKKLEALATERLFVALLQLPEGSRLEGLELLPDGLAAVARAYRGAEGVSVRKEAVVQGLSICRKYWHSWQEEYRRYLRIFGVNDGGRL